MLRQWKNGPEAEEINECSVQDVLEELRKALTPFGAMARESSSILVRIEKNGLFVIVGRCLPAATLSRRQREVLSLIGLDLGNAGIARRLGVTEDTIQYHVSRLLSKFGVSGRAALVRRAAIYGFYADPNSPDDPIQGGS